MIIEEIDFTRIVLYVKRTLDFGSVGNLKSFEISHLFLFYFFLIFFRVILLSFITTNS